MASPSASGSTTPLPVSTLKVLLIGSSSVGKSSLLLKYTDNLFLPNEEAQATIGVDYKVKVINRQNKRYKLSIWDTAGQERFRTLTSSYYRGAHGCFLVYDISERDTFEALQTWFTELETYASPDIVTAIIGNKRDKQFSRVVSTEEGRKLAQERGCLFFETSAKTDQEEVDGMFDALVDKIIATPSLYEQPASAKSLPGSYNIQLDDTPQSSSWCAC